MTVIEQVPADESVHELAENVTEPAPPTSYQTIDSPEVDPT